ncbi:MAG: D-glycero-beta-D-manno-heptose 1-phosphate adenylyltransferase [Planctomycetes bacterium]|nr:D-glycero-beta-D-manno-heptose 1-phosphate adenylyltransferase [Planctomycetota bacterium]
MQDLIQWMQALGRPRVALIGDFMLDQYVYGDCERINPEAPVPVLRVVRRESFCGAAGSVAADILALGGAVRCVGIVGQDAHGDELLSMLMARGGEISTLLRLPTRPTIIKTRLVGLAQHLRPQQMLRVDEEDTSPLPDTVHNGLRAAVRSALSDCRVLAIEDYNKGVLTDATTPQIIADARAAGVPVMVDPPLIADYGRYRGCTLLTPNRYEAQKASGVTITDEASMARAADRIIHAAQADGVVITLDKQGAYLKPAGRPGRLLPAQAREVFEVSGAGDMVLAMLCVAIAGGADWNQAVALAMVAGGLAVERFGIVPVTRQEVLDRLAFEKRQQHGKVVSIDELLSEVRRLRAGGKQIVWTNGCFDILHAGHVQYLNFARRQGDALIVGVNADASVRKNKGPDRPIVGQDDRAEVLAALECVDYVVVFEDETPLEMIQAVVPDVLVKGMDWKGAVVGQVEVEAAGGRVVLADLREGRSTTDIINRITEVYGNGHP